MLQALVVAAIPSHTYQHKTGFIGKGGDALPFQFNVTLDAALQVCSSEPSCNGVTFEDNQAKPEHRLAKVYFKKSTYFIADATWQTYLRDYAPPPPLMNNPCRNTTAPQATQPWCNASLALDDRVADLLSRMSLEEKIAQLGSSAPPIPSLGLNAYDWWNEASHGVASENHGARDTPTTNFAFPITTGMAFNRSLWRATGAAIGMEARAAANIGRAYSTFWAPVINLAREPRWGRNIETPGECPYLTGQYAIQFVKGMQEDASDRAQLLASACCKHYVANSMDNSVVDGEHHWRNEFDARVTPQDLIDSYMAPFQSCVEVGRVSGLMCSYNALNGVPTCASEWLLQTVARGEWGFDGYVTSDCDADNDVFFSHHYTQTPEESVRAVLDAGTDVDCGGFVSKYAPSALSKKVVSEADLDKRLRQLFLMRMRLGHFSPAGPLDRYAASDICKPETIATSLDGAAQAAALLKNDGATLPLSASHSVAVIGPTANLSRGDAGYYGPGNACGLHYWTLVDAVAAHAASVVSALGVPSVSSANTSGIAAAVQLARSVDRVVLALGTDLSWAMEGHDADAVTGISLSPGQKALVANVTAAAKAPVTVVMLTATPLDISALLANPKVGAVVHAGQPAVTVLGIGDLLFGHRSPAGRMVQTVYPEAFATQVSIFDMNMRPGPSAWPAPGCSEPAAQCANGTNPGRTYRFYTGKAVVPFGFGLSYTTFTYSLSHNLPTATVETATAALDLAPLRSLLDRTRAAGRTFVPHELVAAEAPLVQYEVVVTNTGTVDSDDVVLGFLTPPGAGTGGVPLKTLFGFERVHVKAGQSVHVFLYPTLTDFAAVDVEGTLRALAGQYTVTFGLRETAGRMGFAEHSFVAK